jgi:tRNA threonylcarbamoyladenosine biosynthesis protein TsaB
MRILVIDTAGSEGGVVLAQTENDGADPQNFDPQDLQVLGSSELQPREFSRQLIPAIADLLKNHQLSLAQMDALAVVNGPGSFTGLRVGLSAVKALAEATAKPIIALSRLAVMASMAAEPQAELVHAVLDAGRGEFYRGLYRDAGWTCEGESLQTRGELVVRLEQTPGLIVASEPTVLDTLPHFSIQKIAPAGAKEALPLALRSWQARCFRDVATLDANYLRRSDAEILSKLNIARV